MTREEILDALVAIPEGKSDVINDRAVARQHGGFWVEGFRNLMPWRAAAEKLSRKPRKRALTGSPQ